MSQILDIFLHLDVHLNGWVQHLGPWIYILAFLIIFGETGLVIAPFLPGDSFLFALGALTGADAGLSFPFLVVSLIAAGILGNFVNYSIGHHFGDWLIERNAGGRYFSPNNIHKTNEFFERHGGKAVVLGRFLPIIRTFTPFVAGLAKMKKSEFFVYNTVGSAAWVGSFLTLGHLFGDLPGVKSNFHFIIIAIIAVSLLPALFALVKRKEAI